VLNRAAVAALAIILAGCTRTVDSAVAKPQPAVAPIAAAQVSDLLSPDATGKDGNLFVTADPAQCSGVARESDPPFLQAYHPVATDGASWVSTAPGGAAVYVMEMVAVYRSDFDPGAALTGARAQVEACRETTVTVTSARGRTYLFQVLPTTPPQPGDTMLWSLRSKGWDCDNALVAAQNAAVEITGCGELGGFDIAAAAQQAVKRIAAAANTNV
jgi:hypothetical protein